MINYYLLEISYAFGVNSLTNSLLGLIDYHSLSFSLAIEFDIFTGEDLQSFSSIYLELECFYLLIFCVS